MTGLLKLQLCLLIVFVLLLGSLAWAGAAGSPVVHWHVLGGGGAPALSASGSLSLNGTLGQTAIGRSGNTSLNFGAGFWYGLITGAPERIYLPLVLRQE